MIKILHIILFLFVFITGVFAQNSELDSLEHALSLHSKDDTIKVILLNDIAFKYSEKDIEKAMTYLEQSEDLSEKLNYTKGKAKALYIKGITEVVQSNFENANQLFSESLTSYEEVNNLKGVSTIYNAFGILYYYQSDYEKSIEYYKKALAIDEKIEPEQSLSKNYNNIANTYDDMGNFDEAIAYYQKAMEINQKYNLQSSLATSYNNLGAIYQDFGNMPIALEYYNKAMYINEELGDSLGYYQNINNIGILYKNQKKYTEAIEFFKKSLVFFESQGDKKSIARLYNNLGNIFKNKMEYQIAIKYFSDAHSISQTINDTKFTSVCLNNLGDVYLEQGKYQEALNAYSEAKKLKVEIGDTYGLCFSYVGIASCYLYQKRYDSTETYIAKVTSIANDHDALEQLRDIAYLSYQLYKETNQFEKALLSHENYKSLEDSLLNEENIQKMTALEYEYKYKRDLENAEDRELKLTETVNVTTSNLEKSQQNFLIAIIVILALSIISVSIMFYLKYNQVKAQNKNILTQQRLLRTQMTPHFLFNSLSSLQGMILEKEEGRAIKYLSKFSKLLRTILENSRYDTVLLSKEISAIEAYMALINLDTDVPYIFSIKLDKTLKERDLEIPPMLLQPFIENAIEHAFKNKVGDKHIDLSISFNSGQLVAIIRDNGIGWSTSKTHEHMHKKSLATTITKERLIVLSKEFKMKGDLDIKDKSLLGEKGTEVTIIIPYKIPQYNH